MAFTSVPHAFDAQACAAHGAEPHGQRLPRLLIPFLLIPLGAIYCQIHEALFHDVRSSIWASLVWATVTLLPWVAAALAFDHMASAGERRWRLLRRALLLGLAAWVASSSAALLFGSGVEQAFYIRLPMLAAGLFGALLYPVSPDFQSRAADRTVGIASGEASPPVAPTEILYASAAGNYIELHAGGRTILWRQTMQNAERLLGREGFVRVHRSYLVPWRSIERVARGRKGPVAVALSNGRRLPVSNRYAANLGNGSSPLN